MTTYTQLGTDLESYGHSAELSALLPRFVALTETKLNRRLRVRQQETDITGAIDANGEIALPADFAAVKTLWVDGYEGAPLLPQTLECVVANDTDAPATLYAVTDALRFNGTGSVTGVYYKKLPGLEANSTNWLSTYAYDVYLYGVLEEALRYSRELPLADQYGAMFAELTAELNRIDKAKSGPMVSAKR